MPASHQPTSPSIPATTTMSSSVDDDSSAIGNLSNNRNNNAPSTGGIMDRIFHSFSGIMDQLFASCSDDPKGSVHRSWAISLIFMLTFFIISLIEMWNLHTSGSAALVIATVIIGLSHVVLGILGTFVLKRFPTSFSIGFLLGIVLILANQNLILFGTFFRYDYGTTNTNHIFGVLSFVLAVILFLFGILLFHFKNDVVVAPIDIKHAKRSNNTSHIETATSLPSNQSTNYQQYDDQEE